MKRHATYAKRAHLTKGKHRRLDNAFQKCARLYNAALESWQTAYKITAYWRGKDGAHSPQPLRPHEGVHRDPRRRQGLRRDVRLRRARSLGAHVEGGQGFHSTRHSRSRKLRLPQVQVRAALELHRDRRPESGNGLSQEGLRRRQNQGTPCSETAP